MSVEVTPDVVKVQNGKWILDTSLAKSGGGLFAITAVWCSYCSTLKQNIPKAQSMMPFDFFWMDADKTPAHKAKVSEMGIGGFPTLYYISRNGILQEYNGGRDPASLAQVFHRR